MNESSGFEAGSAVMARDEPLSTSVSIELSGLPHCSKGLYTADKSAWEPSC